MARNYTFQEYQNEVTKLSIYPGQRKGGSQNLLALAYTILELNGEAGEIANKLKKYIRKGAVANEDVLADELGDVLWAAGALANELNMTLEDIAKRNLEKLWKRKEADTIDSLEKRADG